MKARVSTETEVDREALTALFQATNGHRWLNNRGWIEEIELWKWSGVQVNADDHVVKLHLGNGQGERGDGSCKKDL